MEATCSESRPLLGPKKKNGRSRRGMKPRFEELTSPCANEGDGKESPQEPRNYGLIGDQPPPYSVEDTSASLIPSAPPASDVNISIPEDPILYDKRHLIRKCYSLIAGQWSLFSGLTLLFVEIPHLRKIVRKNFFDKLFLTSSLGFPLGIFFAALIFFPALRRQFAWLTMIVLTVSLSLLLAYTLTVENALAMFYTTLSADLTCFGVIGSTFLPRFDLSSSVPALLSIPAVMLSSSAVFSSLTHLKWTRWLPTSTIVTLLMGHMAYNTRSLFKDNRLNLTPKEYVFAASNLYLNCDVMKLFKTSRSHR